MRVVLALLFGLFSLSAPVFGQILEPVKWTFESSKESDGEYILKFKATIDPGWAIYSQHIEDGGPIPTYFELEKGGHFEAVGEVEESDNAKTAHDPIFEMKLIKFYKSAEFTQRVKVKDISKPISGYLEFMTCDDEKCLPPAVVEYSFDLSDAAGQGGFEEQDGAGAGGIALDMDGAIEEPQQSGIFKPVEWSYGVEDKGNGKYLLNVTAEIQDEWFVYSQHLDEGGPEPTTFYYNETPGVEFVGVPKEISDHKYEGHDAIFEMQVVKYKKEVTFSQEIKVDGEVEIVDGEFEFMTCNDIRCLPPQYVEMRFDLKNLSAATDVAIAGPGADLKVIDQVIPTIQATFEEPIGDCHAEETVKNKSLFWTFVLGFAGGLLALLTPCVFPMIPLTVSFFSKDTKRKGWMNGVIYGLSIIVIYVTVGLAITAFFGATALNALSTNWIANTLFFLIFVVFAFSFFGFYEIQLPSSWANKSDRMADKGGLIGIFFMAFTLAIVSFSCTGPIIGSAIVQSASSSTGPFVVMLGFSTALALPFGLFAAFPSWLNSLPRSGSWMNSVKVVLGFLELALAFKFLSVADMTSHWNFLRYELFLGIWVVISALMALYLFGIIRFPHDSKGQKIKVGRYMLAAQVAALTIYMATGFMPDDRTKSYNALPMLSGLAPPAHYNFFKPVPEPDGDIKARFASFSKCANNLDCFKDYYEAVEYAKEVQKPLFVDFTGYGCVNCRKTEEHIWVKDDVWTRLKNDFVMVSLYVDDRKPLDEILYSKVQDEKLRNVGNKWADFQIVNFAQNSQPLYVLMTPDEQVLAKPRGYKDNAKDYAEFLQCGLEAFEQMNGLLGEK